MEKKIPLIFLPGTELKMFAQHDTDKIKNIKKRLKQEFKKKHPTENWPDVTNME